MIFDTAGTVELQAFGAGVRLPLLEAIGYESGSQNLNMRMLGCGSSQIVEIVFFFVLVLFWDTTKNFCVEIFKNNCLLLY